MFSPGCLASCRGSDPGIYGVLITALHLGMGGQKLTMLRDAAGYRVLQASVTVCIYKRRQQQLCAYH